MKPFSTPEFLARVRALLRRAKPEVLSTVLKVGDIDARPRSAPRLPQEDRDQARADRIPAARIHDAAIRAACFLAQQLLDNVWGETIYIDERTVDVHVGRLRKAVNSGRMADPIRTVRGAGYALDDRFGRMN